MQFSINHLNQLLSVGETSYDYDKRGNLIEVKTPKTKARHSYDALGRLTMLTRDDERYIYQYDAFNRRVSKRCKQKKGDWQKQWEYHYLYMGQKEIGAVDENGTILELRVLGSGKGAEIGSAVALELCGKTYVPIHDQSGNIAVLIDRDTGKLAEAYAYTAFGEEQIYNEETLNRSSVGNPWHFSSKRLDPESGWIYLADAIMTLRQDAGPHRPGRISRWT